MSGVFLQRAYLLGSCLAVKISGNCLPPTVTVANSAFWHALYLCFSYDSYSKQR